MSDKGIEVCRKIFKEAERHILDGLDTLRKVDFSLLLGDEAGRIELLMTIDRVNRIAGWLELEMDKFDHPAE
jgi:hypothetical protein